MTDAVDPQHLPVDDLAKRCAQETELFSSTGFKIQNIALNCSGAPSGMLINLPGI